jgi:hypothetical protein
MTFADTLPVRRLIEAILYVCSAILFAVDLGFGGLSGLTAIGIILDITGLVTWALPAIQGVYLRSIDFRPHDNTHQDTQAIIRRSTHSAINAALYTTSSIFFSAGGIYNTESRAPIRYASLSGSLLWFLCATMNGWLSQALERQQEDHPGQVVRPLNIDPSVYQFIGELEYFMAGILYAASIWMGEPVAPIRAASNICWLMAGIHGVTRTSQDLALTCQPEEDIERGLSMAGR